MRGWLRRSKAWVAKAAIGVVFAAAVAIPIGERVAETPVPHESVCAAVPVSKSASGDVVVDLPAGVTCVVVAPGRGSTLEIHHVPEPSPPAPTTGVSPRL
jgi:hypothetical protein